MWFFWWDNKKDLFSLLILLSLSLFPVLHYVSLSIYFFLSAFWRPPIILWNVCARQIQRQEKTSQLTLVDIFIYEKYRHTRLFQHYNTKFFHICAAYTIFFLISSFHLRTLFVFFIFSLRSFRVFITHLGCILMLIIIIFVIGDLSFWYFLFLFRTNLCLNIRLGKLYALFVYDILYFDDFSSVKFRGCRLYTCDIHWIQRLRMFSNKNQKVLFKFILMLILY